MHIEPVLQPAVDVIRQTDPATYARMAASPWTVHAIYDGTEASVLKLERLYSPLEVFVLLSNLETAFGVTISDNDGTPLELTYVNVPETVAMADDMSVPPADFMADVLVHEFTHTGDGTQALGEPEAFTAGTMFALKLPPSSGRPIAALSERTRAQFA